MLPAQSLALQLSHMGARLAVPSPSKGYAPRVSFVTQEPLPTPEQRWQSRFRLDIGENFTGNRGRP